MSMRPTFTAAPRLKLRIGNQTIGYAIGFNVNVSVGLEPVYVVGEYGPAAIEPTMYNVVSGALQIVRLRSSEAINKSLAAAGQGAIASTASQFTTTAKGATTNLPTNSILNQQNLFRMLDPAQVLLTKTFDIDVYIRVPVISANTAVAAGQSVTPADFTTQPNSNAAESNGVLTEAKLFTVKDVRITSRNTNISMGSLVNEPLTFQGLLLVGEGSGIEADNQITQE